MNVWYAAGSKDAAEQILGYAGYQYDHQTGLYYAQARYYDDPGYIYHKEELEELYERRAEPEWFV